jgi:hypothetical protein
LKIKYDKPQEMYIRNCYYRIITEILTFCCNNDVDNGLVVTGNPGLGKTSLSYLFILTLIELGVEVLFLFLFLFFLGNIPFQYFSSFKTIIKGK